MARLSIKNGTWYALFFLIVLLALLPILKATSSIQGFDNPNFPARCDQPCDEGQFCAGPNHCVKKYAGGEVPTGNA